MVSRVSCYFVLLAAALVMYSSCRTASGSRNVDTFDSLVLHTEWKFSLYYSGVHEDHGTGDEVIFSGDPLTFKTVRVFDTSGRPLYDIPLAAVLDSLGDIDGLTLLSKDRVFVLQNHGANYAIVDALGNVLEIHSLDSVLCANGKDLYSLYVDSKGIGVLGNDIFLSASWYGPCVDTSEAPFDPLAYYSVETRMCKLARLDLSSTEEDLRFWGCDMLAHLGKGTYHTAGSTGASILGGRIFVSSLYSPDLIEVDTGTLEVIRRVPLSHVNGAVGITPPQANLEDEANDGANTRIGTRAYVSDMVIDRPSGRLLVIVPHEVPEDSPPEKQRASRDWSVVVLDPSLAIINEFVLQGTAYRSGAILGLKSGTWVMRSESGIQGALKPKVFHRLLIP